MHLRSAVLVALALAVAAWWAFLRTPRVPASPSAAPAPLSAAATTPGSGAPESQTPRANTPAPAPASSAASTAAVPPSPGSGSTPPSRRSVADILENAGDLSDPAVRERTVAAMQTLQQERRAAAIARAQQLGLPLRTVGPRGRVREVYDLDEQGNVIYRTTLNLNAARSSGANLLQAETPALTGSGVTVGVWDAGRVRTTHQELTGRVTLKDSSPDIDDHSTHVGGTIGASGVVAGAKGMAPAVSIHSYDWDSDYTEMTAAGATAAGQSTKIYLSNHSYGTINGWDYTGETSPMWIWYGTGTGTTGADPGFGQYGSDARDVDAVVYNTPYLLPFVAAGNDGTDDPVNGESVQLNPDVSTTVSYNSASHPAGDGKYRGGYDTIASSSIGKNVLTVGATSDAVTGTTRDIAKALLVDFSSVGPTDDGRIKPDLVANGEDLNSSVGTSNTAYDIYSGTSMATPSAAGSAALLVQLYGQLFPSGAMRASTLKALLIHTADDLGAAGPDYKNGWGLINVKAAADLLRELAANPNKLRLNESQINPTTATTVTFDFVWDGVSPIRATLCWTDPAATAATTLDSRTSTLVNNLDLKITGPDGSEHLPFVMPFVGTWTQASMASPATTGLNNTDNVEQVLIATPPAAGTYHAVVSYRGTLKNNLAQQFGLIITGSTAEPPPPTAPTITTHPASQSVALGGSVTFSVTASGTAPFTYQWRKNEQPINAATSSTLTLANVKSIDAGSYDVVVTNSVGSATSNAATLTPVNVTTVTWNFTTNGAPSSALPTGVTVGTVTQGNNNGTTSFPDGTAPSSGYTGASGTGNIGFAARIGALNTATGGSAYLTVTLTPDAGKRVVVSSVSFAGRRSNTGPQAWALYSSTDNYATALATGSIANQSTWYLFTPTISTINGSLGTPVTLRVYGYNGSGGASTNTANWRIDDLALTVAVQTAPTITTPPASQSVAAGADATFTVVASGNYQWRRNSQTISGATTASYTIVGVQPGDAASYDVVVTNMAGTATSTAATLTVLSGFDSWLWANFDASERANPQVSGPAVVLTADGLTNLMKYALGLNPRVAATTSLPVTSATSTHWTYTFTRPVERSDVTYTVQASTNLTDWSTITVTPTKISTTDGVETWRAEYPLANAAQLFFRLKVSRTP